MSKDYCCRYRSVLPLKDLALVVQPLSGLLVYPTPSKKSFLLPKVPQSYCCRHGVAEVSKVATEWLTSTFIQELSGEPGS